METVIKQEDMGEDMTESRQTNTSKRAQRIRKCSRKKPAEVDDFIVVKAEDEDVQMSSEVKPESEEESDDGSAQAQDVDMMGASHIPRERFFRNGKELDLGDVLIRMNRARLKPGMKVVLEDEKHMENNAKNALKQRKWRTMRGMVRQAEKLMKEIPTMEFLVVLSFEGGIKFAGTGSLLDHFKNGQPLTDGKPHGVNYTKDAQSDMVDCLAAPACTEVRTPEGTEADPTSDSSDIYEDTRQQLLPELEPPSPNADEDIDHESHACCSDEATPHKRARKARVSSHAPDTLEKERPASSRTSRKKVASPHQGTAPQETTGTTSLQPGTFVYVAVPTSSNRTVPFVAEVMQSEPLNVKYLHPNKTKGTWYYPDKEDTGTINTADIIKVLDAPQTRISGSRFYAEFRDLP